MTAAPKYVGWRLIAPGDRFECDVCGAGAERVVLTRYVTERHNRSTSLCRRHWAAVAPTLERMAP